MSFFPTAQRPSHLVEFNAGKCIRDNNTIKPDERKGTIYMDQSDDQLMHFYWKERKATEPEEDLIIFPDEAEMVPVEECTTGRVYLLKFKSSNQKLFFWMQNKKDDQDEELIAKVNRLINDPQGEIEDDDEGSGHRGGGGAMDFSNDSQDIMQILGESGQDIGMSQENLMQFLQAAGGFGGSVPSHLNEDESTHNGMDVDEQQRKRLDASQVTSLKDILAGISLDNNETSTPTTITLSDQVSAALPSLLRDEPLRQALFPSVPASTDNMVQTPEFQSSLQKINKALDDGSLDSILSRLGLDSSADINTFLKTLEEQAELRHGQQGANGQNDAMEL
ncbi:hypothetical protein [Absidia glauca]|uniref:Pru domain-containing protein n=1 Tax=Absidia glauca TaxID=4829 RepID=A0A168KYS1_ABSGL|nr:hypothetical protein [Absidia glauca]